MLKPDLARAATPIKHPDASLQRKSGIHRAVPLNNRYALLGPKRLPKLPQSVPWCLHSDHLLRKFANFLSASARRIHASHCSVMSSMPSRSEFQRCGIDIVRLKAGPSFIFDGLFLTSTLLLCRPTSSFQLQ
jgi:hypothetical protein